MKLASVLVMSALAALAACGQKAGVSASGVAASEGERLPPLAPAIIPPDEVADPTEPPSYEVAIASAAAQRNSSLTRCANQPEAVRAQCEQEANAAFAANETKLQDLRGNKE